MTTDEALKIIADLRATLNLYPIHANGIEFYRGQLSVPGCNRQDIGGFEGFDAKAVTINAGRLALQMSEARDKGEVFIER